MRATIEGDDVTGGQGGWAYGVAPAGGSLPAATRLGAVRLQVTDLDRSLRFYERVLGLLVLRRSEAEVALGVPGSDEALVELTGREGARPAPRGGRLGLYHFAILLPNRDALGRFVRHLAEVGARAGASDHLVSEALYLQDPDGLGIEVYADRPRSSWRRRGRELEMATQPLDLVDLRAAAGDAPWTGMPEGTVVGHVHLHVGNLDAAAAFYHEALGFEKVVWSYPGALFLSAGGYHHHLGLNTWAAGASPAAEDEARLLEWEIVAPSAEAAGAAIDRLERAGYPVERSADGGRIADPWGTMLRITGR